LGLIAVTGRFQPFHRDHLDLVQQALAIADRVLIGVTNADAAELRRHPASPHRHLTTANPFSFEQRRQLIEAALAAAGVAAARYEILPFPLDEPGRWPAIVPPGTPQLVRVFSDWEREKVRRFAAAGYAPRVLSGDAATRVSGSDIRRAMQARQPWQQWVPPGTRELLQRWRGPAQ
jgi:cytidyltransferase-like protein